MSNVPEPDEHGYWTRTPDGGLCYHAYEPATEDDDDIASGEDMTAPAQCDYCGSYAHTVEKCPDFLRDHEEQAKRDAATDKSEWPL